MQYAVFQNKKIDKTLKMYQLVSLFSDQAKEISKGVVPKSLFTHLSFQSVHSREQGWSQSSQLMNIYQNYYSSQQAQNNLMFKNSPLGQQIDQQQQLEGNMSFLGNLLGGIF